MSLTQAPPAVVEKYQSNAIGYFFYLIKKSRTLSEFRDSIKEVFRNSEMQTLKNIVVEIESECGEEDLQRKPVEGRPMNCSDPQLESEFSLITFKMSDYISTEHISIMTAVSHINDSEKPKIVRFTDLCSKLKQCGCISETNVEYLKDLLSELRLDQSIRLLEEYENNIPPPPSNNQRTPLRRQGQVRERPGPSPNSGSLRSSHSNPEYSCTGSGSSSYATPSTTSSGHATPPQGNELSPYAANYLRKTMSLPGSVQLSRLREELRIPHDPIYPGGYSVPATTAPPTSDQPIDQSPPTSAVISSMSDQHSSAPPIPSQAFGHNPLVPHITSPMGDQHVQAPPIHSPHALGQQPSAPPISSSTFDQHAQAPPISSHTLGEHPSAPPIPSSPYHGQHAQAPPNSSTALGQHLPAPSTNYMATYHQPAPTHSVTEPPLRPPATSSEPAPTRPPAVSSAMRPPAASSFVRPPATSPCAYFAGHPSDPPRLHLAQSTPPHSDAQVVVRNRPSYLPGGGEQASTRAVQPPLSSVSPQPGNPGCNHNEERASQFSYQSSLNSYRSRGLQFRAPVGACGLQHNCPAPNNAGAPTGHQSGASCGEENPSSASGRFCCRPVPREHTGTQATVPPSFPVTHQLQELQSNTEAHAYQSRLLPSSSNINGNDHYSPSCNSSLRSSVVAGYPSGNLSGITLSELGNPVDQPQSNSSITSGYLPSGQEPRQSPRGSEHFNGAGRKRNTPPLTEATVGWKKIKVEDHVTATPIALESDEEFKTPPSSPRKLRHHRKK